MSPEKITVLESDVDEQVAYVAQQFAEDKPAGRKDLQENDLAIMNVDFLWNGTPDKKLTGDYRAVEFKRGMLPDAFIDGFLGMQVGETRKIHFELPGRPSPDRDRDVEVYDVEATLLEVRQIVIPTIDDEWVESHIEGFKTLAEMRASLRKDLELQKAKVDKQAFVLAVRKAIASRIQGTIPDEMYQQAKDNLMEQTTKKVEAAGQTLEEYCNDHGIGVDAFNMNTFMQASEMLRQNLALDAFAEHAGYEVSEEEIKQVRANMGGPVAKLSDEEFEARGYRRSLIEHLKRNKALDYLMDTATVE